MSKTKRSYQPPMIADLSGAGAQGQTEGICGTGFNPVDYTCTAGPLPFMEDRCSPTGISPTLGGCTGSGGAAVEGCATGSLFPTSCTAGTNFG